MTPVISPINQFFDTDGSPLDAGFIYFGLPNQNPETAPAVVYWDEGGTQPVAQPVITLNGYTVRAGTPAAIYTSDEYSVTVRNRRGKMVLYAASNNSFIAQLANQTDPNKGASLIGYKRNATGSVGRTVSNKLDEIFSVKDFGVKGDGVTDDTAKINAAETAAAIVGGTLYFPPGTYIINNGAVLKQSGVTWRGAGKRKSIIKAAATAWATSMISGGTVDGASFYDLGFDMTAAINPGLSACIAINNWTNSEIADCDFQMKELGINISGGSQFTIRDNTITAVTAIVTLSEGIWIRNTSAPVSRYVISGNILTKVGTDFNGSDFHIIDNNISGWIYGGGITTEQGSSRALIEGNYCVGGFSIDSNNVPATGIENWTSFSVINGNLCANNSGAGISSGGAGCVVSNNHCVNNGQYTGAGSSAITRCGISSRYVNSTYNGNTSNISGNICLDTGGGTQVAGYVDDGPSVSSITLKGNLFTGTAGPMNATGVKYDFHGPQLQLGVNGLTGFTLGAGSSTAAVTQAVAGATMGDQVRVSINLDGQGLMINGWVSSAGIVSFRFYNPTAGSITLANYTAFIKVEKPINYGTY